MQARRGLSIKGSLHKAFLPLPLLLQGAVLQSSSRGGIRIQYSKNPLGKRKDY